MGGSVIWFLSNEWWCDITNERGMSEWVISHQHEFDKIISHCHPCDYLFIICHNTRTKTRIPCVNVDIGNYVVLGLLCTLYKLIWEAIAGDTSLITPPPPRVGSNPGFKPATHHAHWTSHGVMWWTKTIIYPIVLHFDVIITQILTGWRDEHFFLYQAKSTQIDQTSGGR